MKLSDLHRYLTQALEAAPQVGSADVRVSVRGQTFSIVEVSYERPSIVIQGHDDGNPHPWAQRIADPRDPPFLLLKVREL